MAGRSLSMSIIEEIKRYKAQGLSNRAIARALKCSRKTITKYLEQTDQIETALPVLNPPLEDWTQKIDWEFLHDEVKNHVPLQILWEEQSAQGRCPVLYPAFWKQFNKRFPCLEVTMVRQFPAGERVEIDYCDGIEILVPSTGEILKTHLFVGVLCRSRYTYAEFSFSQKSQDFLSSHVRMFEYFGGIPHQVSPDNLKSAVNKTHRYDPEINPAYTRLASHYNFVVTPARVRTPKDKAIVERNVQIFQRWFFFKVRKQTFTSLAELNQCLHENLKIFHQKTHRVFKKTRQEMFEEEKKHLLSLPQNAYEVSIHKKAKLHTDCHLEFDHNYYSAPWKLRGHILDVWATDKVIEIYDNGDRVAFHKRDRTTKGNFHTKKEHYPPQHQAYLEITPCFLRETAQGLGENVFNVIEKLLSGPHPLAYLRRSQGILALAKKYDPEKLNAACAQALMWEKFTTPFIENLIKHSIRQTPLEESITRNENPFFRKEELYQ